MDVLAIGREAQPATREGGSINVHSLQLDDQRPHGQKAVSGLQAEIVCGDSGLTLISKGQSFNFVNESPLHATSSRRPTSMQIYDGDVLRFGGNLDGKPGGGVQDFVFRVDAPALGSRPTPTEVSNATAHVAAPAAAAASSGGDAGGGGAHAPSPALPAAAPAVAAASGGGDAGGGTNGASTPMLIAAGGGADITLRPAGPSPANRTPLGEDGGAGFVSSNQVGSFDLHARAASTVSWSGRTGSWVTLAAGQQRLLHDGDEVEVEGVRYMCRLP